MGIFTRKPDRALQAELVKRASQATNWFWYTLQSKKTVPHKGAAHQAIDLTIKENRESIRDELVVLVSEHQLTSCAESTARLLSVAKNTSTPRSPIEDVAIDTAIYIGAVDCIAGIYYQHYPKYQPLFEMVDNLANICCSGAAQIIGQDLPYEINQAWPYFSRIFIDARSNSFLWPDLETERSG